jgi:multicomponent Na+:H+ antiporter subunit D
MVGAFSISGVPLFNGFISKSMIITAAGDDGRGVAELLLTLASIGTFLHTRRKLPYFTYFGQSRGLVVKAVPRNMIAAMGVAAACCIGLGLVPGWLYARLATPVDYHPYTLDHVAGSLQLLAGTALAFWWLLGKLKGEATESIDTDALYRTQVPRAIGAAASLAAATGAAARALAESTVRLAAAFADDPLAASRWLGGTGSKATVAVYDENRYRLPIGVTVFWVVLALWVVALLV